jgi:putative copper resistance protein D
MALGLILAATAAAYLAAARRVPGGHAARHAAGWPLRRSVLFVGGLVLLAAALLSPLHAAGERSLTAHMVQHLLLTLVIPPLLVLGRPAALMLRGGPVSARRPLATLLRAAAPLGHPALALATFAAVLVGTHAPAFYDAALRHGALHDLEHLLYLGAALLFWQVVLAPEPHPRAASPVVRMLLVVAAMLPMAVVGVGLLVPDHVVYPTYGHDLADQRRGGSIMWLWGTLFLAVALIAAGWWGVVREHRRQLAVERALGGAR